LELVVWQGRQATILFDASVSSNESVAAARRMLAQELRTRGAVVRFVDIPIDAGVNGVGIGLLPAVQPTESDG
jgi:hypothetical protein